MPALLRCCWNSSAAMALIAAALVPFAHSADTTTGPEPGFLKQYAATGGFQLGRPAAITIAPDAKSVLFLRSGPRSFVRDLYEFDVASGQERVLLTAEQLLEGKSEQLSVEELARRERMRSTARGIAGYQLSDDGQRILVPLGGKLFVFDRTKSESRALPDEGGYPIDPRFSHDGKFVACVREGDLYVIDVETGNQQRLTTSATATLSNGLAEFVAQEEMGRMAGYWWSPDDQHLVYQQTETAAVEELHIMDPARPERPPNSFRYPRAGKPNAVVKLGVIPRAGGTTTWIEWDREKHPYLATVRWTKNAPLSLLVQNREQTEAHLLTADPASGGLTLLHFETDSAWLNLDQEVPHWLEDGQSFLWTTERGGTWQLELRRRDGSLVGPLTSPELGLRGLIAVDERRRVAFVAASDLPTQSHVMEVSLEPQSEEPPRRLTMLAGMHSVSFSKDFSLRLHSASAPNVPHSQRLLRANGEVLGELRSVAEQPSFGEGVEFTTVEIMPEGAAESLTLQAKLVRPRAFDPAQKYPVIVAVYGGPQSQTVLESYGHHMHQWMADHGFIVVSLDGRGTPNRGRAWERAIKGNLIAVPLADQAAGLKALGRKYRELDLSRVGIQGWSFGGYFSAMAVMQRPDVYHAGIAGAPVVDWLDYDTHYTERYLGVPSANDPAYRASSVLTYAGKLRRPLLWIHGTADDNVYFTHTMKAADALFRAGLPFDFLPLAGQTHMVADPLLVERRAEESIRYFRKHLLEATPTAMGPASGGG